MNNLPPELLHKIFIQLDLPQKVICTLVCRNWWSALDRYSLLCNVEINHQRYQFDRFMNMITRSPHRAAQVETLTIKGRLWMDFNKRTLCSTFPNLRYIKLDYDDTSPRSKKPIRVTRRTSKIQHICDRRYCEYALQMMHSKLCGQLETLELELGYWSSRQPTIIRQLKNMPVLKNLTIQNPHLSVADFELLHNNVPSIQTLNLNNMRMSNSEVPKIIIPAPFLTEVNFNMVETYIPYFHNRWYLYISSKYANVKKWCYNDTNQYCSDFEVEFFYQNGFHQFLELIAPTRSDMTLRSVPRDIDVFRTFDNVGARIEDFELIRCLDDTTFENLANSNQFNYVTKLTLSNTAINSIHYFENLPGLTNLRLDNVFCGDDSDALNLTAFLNAMPDTLTSFSVNHDKGVEIDPVNCKLSSVMYLSISCPDLTKDIGEAVSTYFPKLVEANFFCIVNCDVKIALQSQSLKFVRFNYRTRQSYGFSFKCSTQIKPQFYLIDYYHKATPVTYEEAKTKPIVSFVSYTTKSLEFTPDSIEISS